MTLKDNLSPKLSRADIFVLMACLFSTGLCFAASVGFDFVSWDDPLFITRNPLVTATGNTLSDWWLTPTLGYPIPITVFTYWVEYQLVEDTPWLFHLNNLIIHLLSVGLLFVLARRLGLSTVAAALTTLLFALHPVVVEPVCWATGRKDLLAGFFGLSSGMMFLLGPPPSIRSRRCWLTAGMFTLAMLSKPASVFWLPLFALVQLHRSDPSWRAKLKSLLPVTPLLVVVSVVVPLAFVGLRTVENGGRVVSSVGDILREAWFACGFHLNLVLGLQTSTAKYLPQPWPPESFTTGVDLTPIIVAGVLAIMGFYAKNNRDLFFFGLSWALLAYLPSSSLIPLTRIFADSYLYMCLPGLGFALGATLDVAIARHLRVEIAAMVVGAFAATLFIFSLNHVSHWRDSVSLWGQAYQTYPHDYRLCRNLGNALFSSKHPELALDQYRECSRRHNPRLFDKNIGVALYTLGELNEAEKRFKTLLKHSPKDQTAMKYLNRIRSRRSQENPASN